MRGRSQRPEASALRREESGSRGAAAVPLESRRRLRVEKGGPYVDIARQRRAEVIATK